MKLRSQQGNTFVGIVIGLVIGLAIAVVVALVITKGATPFTDKGHPSKSAETTAGQAADPNKPMYGNKEAAREAARDFAKEAPKAPAADPLQAVVDKIQATPAAPAQPPAQVEKPKAAAAPLTPGASNVAPQPVAKAAPAAADAGEEKFIYYLQAGAFREVADAESARAKLALLGFEANLSDRATDTGVLHRVRIGPFNQVEAMNKVRSKLSENGIDVAVVRNQK